MQLTPNDIHIWSGNLIITPAQEAAYLTLLNEEERARAQRFKFPKDKSHFTGARGMLRKILSLYISLAPETIPIQQGEHGKPFVKGLEFNLSHSGDMAVYAISLHSPLGIDIEQVQNTSHAGVIEKYFSESEKKTLKQLSKDQQNTEFYRIWTRKEALIKALGKGFFMSLSHLDDAATSWCICSLSIHPDYQTALAYQPPTKAISQFVFQHV